MELLNEVFRWLAAFFQFGVVFVGFPAQIHKNYTEGKSGEAGIKVFLVLGTFFFRPAAALADGMWYIFVPDIVGFLLISLLLSQVYSPCSVPAMCISCLYDFLYRFAHWLRQKIR